MTDYISAEQFILSKLKKELPQNLTYHGLLHVYDVLEAAMRIAGAEKVTEEERNLIRIAVVIHDSGFITLYRGHEEKGCDLARQILPQYGFSGQQIETINGMIMATRLPQQPHAKLERIIADADLDYLGREDFYTIGNTLFSEFIEYGFVKNEREWNELQLKFLRNHHYHTSYCKKLREGEKQQRILEIEKLLND
ncbi:MAG: HD domain-containing protein [Chitinophagales bacterium]|nr:HD domain-containing protein [Chitinophagales bacterium]